MLQVDTVSNLSNISGFKGRHSALQAMGSAMHSRQQVACLKRFRTSSQPTQLSDNHCKTDCSMQGAPRRPFIAYPPSGMYMNYGMDMGSYRGRGRGPMPMQPGRFAQPAYGYGYGYGYFPPPFAQPFPGRMPPGARMGGRAFMGERRPPPGTPGVSSGLQVIYKISQNKPQPASEVK